MPAPAFIGDEVSAAGFRLAGALRPILAAARPLVLLVPDVRGAIAVPDVVGPIRAQLGMAESVNGG
jgi:hypothetical protein